MSYPIPQRLLSPKPTDSGHEEDPLEKVQKQVSLILQEIEERRKQEEDHLKMSTTVDQLLSEVPQPSSLDPNAAVPHNATPPLQLSQQANTEKPPEELCSLRDASPSPIDIGLTADSIIAIVQLRKSIEFEIGQIHFWRKEYSIKIKQIDPNALSHERATYPASPLLSESDISLELENACATSLNEKNEIEQLQVKLQNLKALNKRCMDLYKQARELAISNPKPQPNTSELQSMIIQLRNNAQIQVDHIRFWQEQYRKKREYRNTDDPVLKDDPNLKNVKFPDADPLPDFSALSLPKPIPDLDLNGLSQQELVKIKLKHERYLEQLKEIRIFCYKQYQNPQRQITVNKNSTSPVTDSESQTSELMSIITRLHKKTNFQIERIKFWQDKYREKFGSFNPADIPEELILSLSLEPRTEVDLSGLSKEQLDAVKLQHERTLEQLEMLRIFWFEIYKTPEVPINRSTITSVENANLPVNNKIVENSNLPVNNNSTILKIISALFAAGICMCFYVYIPYYLKQIKV